MFWKTDLAPPSSQTQLETILDAEDVSLNAVLDDSLTIQEIRNGHVKLLNYLASPNTIEQLLQEALQPKVDESLPYNQRYRRAYQCTEVLSLGSNEMCDSMLSHKPSSHMLCEFLRSEKLNNLLVSFYTKIVTHLLNKRCEKLLEELRHSDFFSLCLKNLRYSAVADLLYQMTSAPRDLTTQEFVRQWYTENRFGERLCELLSPEEDTLVHGNVSYLWCELLTTLREYQYQYFDEKMADAILESLQSEKLVHRLLDLMLPEDSGKRSESVIAHAAPIVIALLETNYIPDRPSFLLGLDEKFDQSHFGKEHATGSGDYNVWLPDPEGIVEAEVAAIADRLVVAISDSLMAESSGLEPPNDSWFHLMQVLVQVLNTNHVATHRSIVNAFSTVPSNSLHLLFSQVSSRPWLTLYQVYLGRCIKFILNTVSPIPSPLIQYLLKDCNLLGWIISVYENSLSQQLPSLCRRALRGFSLNLALAVHQARIDSTNSTYIDRIIAESEQANDWEVLINGAAQKYEEENACNEPGLIQARESMRGPVNADDELAVEVVAAAKAARDREEAPIIHEEEEPSMLLDPAKALPVPESGLSATESDETTQLESDITSSLVKMLTEDDEKFEQEIEEMRQLGFDTSLVSKEQEELKESNEGRAKVRRIAVEAQRVTSFENPEVSNNFEDQESLIHPFGATVMPPNATAKNNMLSGDGDGEFLVGKEKAGFGPIPAPSSVKSQPFEVEAWPSASNLIPGESSDWADFTSGQADDWPPSQATDDLSWPGNLDSPSTWPGNSDLAPVWPGTSGTVSETPFGTSCGDKPMERR